MDIMLTVAGTVALLVWVPHLATSTKAIANEMAEANRLKRKEMNRG